MKVYDADAMFAMNDHDDVVEIDSHYIKRIVDDDNDNNAKVQHDNSKAKSSARGGSYTMEVEHLYPIDINDNCLSFAFKRSDTFWHIDNRALLTALTWFVIPFIPVSGKAVALTPVFPLRCF
jgi:hypothetical protein